jgi:transposase
MATLLAVSRAAVTKVLKAYTNHGKTSSARRNSGRKPKLSETDHRILKRIASKNHRTTTAKVTAELNIQLEDHFHKKQSDESFTNQHLWKSCNC